MVLSDVAIHDDNYLFDWYNCCISCVLAVFTFGYSLIPFNGVTMYTPIIISFVVSYLIGSLLFAIIVSKLLNLEDPRSIGSRNPGVTNVLRNSGKLPAILTLIGDVLKGTIAVFLVGALTANPIAVACSILGVVLGHMYPIYFGFSGGKSVATSVGAYLGVSIPLFGSVALIWFFSLLVFRISSVSSLSATLSAPILAWIFGVNLWIVGSAAVVFLLVWFRHRENIERLLAGKESKVKL